MDRKVVRIHHQSEQLSPMSITSGAGYCPSRRVPSCTFGLHHQDAGAHQAKRCLTGAGGGPVRLWPGRGVPEGFGRRPDCRVPTGIDPAQVTEQEARSPQPSSLPPGRLARPVSVFPMLKEPSQDCASQLAALHERPKVEPMGVTTPERVDLALRDTMISPRNPPWA